MTTRVGRPIFKRGVDYVAVRPLSLGVGHQLNPGDKVDLPVHRLRALYTRRRIGPAGHPWTDQAIATQGGYPLLMPQVSSDPVPDDQSGSDGQGDGSPETPANVPAATVPADTSGVKEDGSSGGDDPSSADDPENDDETPVKVDAGWMLPRLTDQVFATKKAASAWLAEQQEVDF